MPTARTAGVERVQRSAKMECNLLGLTVDEALPEVDSFIDRAILNGQTVVYLIHGNGTGALRGGGTAIHKHLRATEKPSGACWGGGRRGRGGGGKKKKKTYRILVVVSPLIKNLRGIVFYKEC